MSIEKRIMTLTLALGVAIAIAGCNEDKTASTSGEKSSTADAVKDAAKAASEKVDAAADAVKEAAKTAADKASEQVDKAAEAVKGASEAVGEKIEEAKTAAADAAKDAAAAVSDKVEEMKKEAPAVEKPAEAAAPEASASSSEEAKPAEAPAASDTAAAAGDSSSQPDDNPTEPDNAAVRAKAQELGLVWQEGRYRDKDGHPAPVVTKDYKVDWATWQGFRRYHDACHVCHGPNALGSTFAPSLAESLKTMDYETFFGTVVGGKRENKGGTEFVMPAFGEDKNIMCYLDDIYTYIKARSTDAMPAGRPAGRQDISGATRKANDECFGQ